MTAAHPPALAVEFHTGVDEPLMFAIRMLGKACRLGARVLVTAPAERLQALDRLLWTFDERSFLPHACVPQASPAMRARSPIWLAGQQSDLADEPRILINLGADAPAFAARLQRLIEVVGTGEAEVAAGRERWRQYKLLGLNPHHWAADAVHQA